jgi:PAS domain S-box-containing protein
VIAPRNRAVPPAKVGHASLDTRAMLSAPRIVPAAIACAAAVLIVAIWAAAVFAVQAHRRSELAAAATNTANLARAFEEHVLRSLDEIDQALLRIKRESELRGRPVSNDTLAAEQRALADLVGAFAIADARGNIVAHSQPSFKSVNIADAAHFQALAAHDTGKAEIGVPTRGHVTGLWSLPVVRRINKPDGSFAGIAHAGVQVSYFDKFYHDVDLGAGGLIVLIGRDGVLRVSIRKKEINAGTQLRDRALAVERVERGELSGSHLVASPVDGIRRVVSYRAMERYPLIVAVGIAERDALADAAGFATDYYVGASAFTAFILLMAFLLIRTTERRRRTASALLAILDAEPECVKLMAADGSLLEMNRAGLEIVEADSIEQIRGRCLHPLVAPEDRPAVYALVDRVFRGESATLEFRLTGLKGAARWLEIHAAPLRDEHDRVTALLGITRDITARKRAEEKSAKLEAQLRQSQKMEALGTLAGGIAHDFNNILSAIIGNVGLARRDVGLEPRVQESLAEIGKASARARDLVQQILTFSRQQSQERRVTQLRTVVEESVKLLRASLPAGIELATDLAGDTPNVLADRTQIHQVLMNLGANAWQAMEGRAGRIEIALKGVMLDDDAPHIDLPRGRYARLSVSDTGKGMDTATAERIFDPFFTTKPLGEGTGLGLAVVDGIVKSHGGAIAVYSEPGRGSVFHLYFPGVDAEVETSLQSPSSVPRGSGQRILYLDDEVPLVFLATRHLQALGYVVRGFSDAASALAAFRAAPDAFDIVVTDLNMPGASGLEVAGEMLRLRPSLPLVLISGYVTEELHARARAIGVREVIYKPSSVEDIAIAIGRTLADLAAGAGSALAAESRISD